MFSKVDKIYLLQLLAICVMILIGITMDINITMTLKAIDVQLINLHQ